MHSRISHASFIPVLAFVLSLLLTGCGDEKKPHQDAPHVTYITVQTQPQVLTTELPGRTTAYTVSEVRPQVSGIIQERMFVEGTDVVKDQQLYQIDPATYRAAYDSAKASLMRAEANLTSSRLLAERYRSIVKDKAVSKQDYDNAVAAFAQAKADVASAQAAVDTARINLEYTKVRAPISGRIGRSAVTPGALVTQNQASPLATIQRLDLMYVDVTQSSTDLLHLNRAHASGKLTYSENGAVKVALRLEDGSLYRGRDGKIIFGEMLFSEVTVAPTTGAVTRRAEFENPDGILLPGMYARVVVEEGLDPKAILIPQRMISHDIRGRAIAQKLTKNATIQNEEGIYNLGTVTLVVDRAIGNQWLVTEGLKEGDLVLDEGTMNVQRGKPVRGTPSVPVVKDRTDSKYFMPGLVPTRKTDEVDAAVEVQTNGTAGAPAASGVTGQPEGAQTSGATGQ